MSDTPRPEATPGFSPAAQRAILAILGAIFAFAVIVTAIMEKRPSY